MNLMLGDCILKLKELPENSVDAIVTDPPYGLSFMGKKWDYDVPSKEMWIEALRVLKPGGHLLSFGGTRTYHRMVVNIEDAGFEVRDQIQWLYGSGFPKSHNLKDEWKGWGSALKPANEPIVLARKPLSENTLALNVLKWGTGVLNIDRCRIELTGKRGNPCRADGTVKRTNANTYGEHEDSEGFDITQGRWPANLILDEQASFMLEEQTQSLHGAGFSNTLNGKKIKVTSFGTQTT